MERLKAEITKHANKDKAKLLARYFKTGKGEYGEGDVFLGISVPKLREIAKEFGKDLSIAHIKELLNSEFHEKRMIGLFILIEKYEKSKQKNEREKIFDFYLEYAKKGKINNWDLVDLSCRDIVGNFLLDKPRDLLYKLVKSDNLWERRIAIISTSEFIRHNDFDDTIKISEILLKDGRDLIHKAVGWMLREIGKRDEKVLIYFLDKHARDMPRVMLRYAIERLDEKTRKKYLNGKF